MSSSHEIETIGDVTVLRLHDPSLMQFDSIPATTELCENFFRDSPTQKTLINFGQIEFFNSVSLGLIASLRKKAEKLGRSVGICNLNPRSIWSIQATRLHTVLDIYHDEELGLSMLRSGPELQTDSPAN
jgi:anti-anti-sigma factor